MTDSSFRGWNSLRSWLYSSGGISNANCSHIRLHTLSASSAPRGRRWRVHTFIGSSGVFLWWRATMIVGSHSRRSSTYAVLSCLFQNRLLQRSSMMFGVRVSTSSILNRIAIGRRRMQTAESMSVIRWRILVGRRSRTIVGTMWWPSWLRSLAMIIR